MKRKMNVIVSLVLALSSAIGLTACGGNKNDEDPTKTYLDVGVFDAGLGTTYFDELKKDFEAYYANTSFEEGKTGVVLRATKKSTEFNPTNLLNSITKYEPVLYILDHGDYDAFTQKDLFYDITDIMTEKYLDADGNIAADTGKDATQSIEDTMYDGYETVFKKDGKYYAVPYTLTLPGIIYDADLFGDENLYFKADGSIGASAEDVANGNCSAGPDKKLGTSDDGLPTTWADFLTLLERIRTKNYTPFTWSADTQYQLSELFNVFWANYEGYDNYMLNYSLNGTDSNLGEINENNFTELLKQEGRKAAIKAFYDISSNTANYTKESRPGGGNSHTGAQQQFIQSKKYGTRIAMTVESSYWEQEARSVFNKDSSYGKRNFKYMPIPNFVGVDGIEDQTNTKRILPATLAESYMCISAKSANKKAEVQITVAKLFIKFAQSRTELVKYTKNTGCIRPYNYTATAEEKAECTPYTQSILTFIEEGAKIAPSLSISELRRKYTGETGFFVSDNGFAFRVKNGTSTYMSPFRYFYDYNITNNGSKTVLDAYNDMITYQTAILKEAGAIK